MHYTFRRNLGHTSFMADLLLDDPLIQDIGNIYKTHSIIRNPDIYISFKLWKHM